MTHDAPAKRRHMALISTVVIACVMIVTHWHLTSSLLPVGQQESQFLLTSLLNHEASINSHNNFDTLYPARGTSSRRAFNFKLDSENLTETENSAEHILQRNKVSVGNLRLERTSSDCGFKCLNTSGGCSLTTNFTTDGIFWPADVTRWIPEGMSLDEADILLQKTRHQRVVSLQPATTNQCGRPFNGVVILKDGTQFCARYRRRDNRPILGELLAYHLSRLLGMDNVPPVTLSHVTVTSQTTWADADSDLHALQWSHDSYVALIGWVDGLNGANSAVRMPSFVSQALHSNTTLHSASLVLYLNTTRARDVNCTYFQDHRRVEKELAKVAQWSSMVILDYLTANYDRAASLLDTIVTNTETIRNLHRTPRDKLWLFDNEAAFFISYQLLHQGSKAGEELAQAHSKLLRSICVFQRNVVQRLTALGNSDDCSKTLEEYTRRREPFYDHVTLDSDAYWLFRKFFRRRVEEVVNWIQYCRTRI